MAEQHLFKWRHFQAEIILLCVRWYVRYALSYRDLEERWMYLYRAVDSDGNTLEILLSPTRDAEAATRFFCQALHATVDA
ncbi:MAG TPA: DDE-type integrase/transposase/recombinase, partial [Ktedonobacteraceae bacterium]